MKKLEPLKERGYRDFKVRDICRAAGIGILTFYSSYPNEQSYVVERVLKSVSKQSE